MLTIRETPRVPPEHPLGRRDLFTYPGPGRVKISAVIITYNEARNIRRTLSRLYWCDEIVILDSFSTDDTVDICREFGCRVYFKHFEGYGAQKRHAVTLAKNDWVLCLDADEVLSEALIVEIDQEFQRGPAFSGYQFPMNLVFLGREFRYGKESRRYFLRLFRKTRGRFNEAKVHERIELRGDTGKMKNALQHFSYDNLGHWIAKMDRYSTLGAEEAVKRGKCKSVFALFLSVPYYFLRYYFMERNFLNGLEGFYWAVLCSYYHFIKYAKIRELHARPPRFTIS
ncbi:glycosyltransferase family 2 protein [Puia dinghuensis]|uniref:Glycosyl transferase n=1 Tax=Puia dinghuensis TaxID=1792502 RepID=A0A8J2XT43_9BACT|nr:glycosyltransferase family 2 protein [Puia dinghuensis]GGB00897.1 glycosyl transferase [Puia dinghuensis]